MKKIIAVLGICILGFGIFRYCENDFPEPSKDIDCSSPEFKYLVDNLSYDEQLNYLKKYNSFICNDAYYRCIVDFHNLKDSSVFNNYAKAHPENTKGIIYYEITADEIEKELNNQNFTNCYEKHVSFLLSKTPSNNVKLDFVDFDKNKSCYSIPVLKGILLRLKDNNEDPKTKFQFCNAVINGRNSVIFKIENTAMVSLYCDLTLDPKILAFY